MAPPTNGYELGTDDLLKNYPLTLFMWVSIDPNLTNQVHIMQYTKPMIDLVFRIRKTSPVHLKPLVKLANPDLLDDLAHHYSELQDSELKDYVSQLMALAGPGWSELLSKKRTSANALNKASRPAPRKETGKMYRGQKVFN